MKKGASILLLLGVTIVFGQSKTVAETVDLEKQMELVLNFPFADEIKLETWDKQQVFLEATIQINGGEDNDLFTLKKNVDKNRVAFKSDVAWKKEKSSKWNCYNEAKIAFLIKLPESLEISANTIAGNFQLDYFGQPLNLKTISGDIDAWLHPKDDVTFELKMLNGGVYSDLTFEFPEGKKGLAQILGSEVTAQRNSGSDPLMFETISGNIYLRERK